MLVYEHSALNSAQHSFHCNQYTVTNLIVTENYLGIAVNSCEPLDIILFDFFHMLLIEFLTIYF